MCVAGAARRRTTPPRSRRRVARDEVEYVVGLPGDGAETEVFFSDLGARVRDDQRGVHDVSDAARDVGTLLEALPYIREFHGKTVVIKYGGAAMEDPALREEFARDVVLLKYVGLNPIVVHGGGPEITALHGAPRAAGRVRRRPARVATPTTVEVAKMVLVGKVNKDIVLRLNRHGQPAVGLCGDDGQLFRVEPPGRARRRGRRLRRARSSASTSTSSTTSPRTTSRSSPRSAPTARAAPTTSTPTRRRAPSRARSAPTRSCSSPTSTAGCATPPTRRASVISEAGADEVEAALPAIAGGMRPKLAGLRRRDPRRRDASRTSSTGACRTRSCSSSSPTPASARRSGPRREPATAGSSATYVAAYARCRRVRPRRGRAAVGRRRQRVPRLPDRHRRLSVGHCHPAVVAAVREQVGRLHPRRQPLLHRAEVAPRRAAGGGLARRQVFFANSGAEANEAAIKLARKAKPRRRRRLAAARLPRAHLRRAVGARRRSPSRRRSRRSCRASAPSSRRPRRSTAAVDDRTAAVLLEPVQGESGVYVAARRAAARRARGLRRARRGADLRRGPVRAGRAPARCGPTSTRASCPTR